jgi:hypothetical protein
MSAAIRSHSPAPERGDRAGAWIFLFDETGPAFERRVKLTEIDMSLFDPAAVV